MQKEKAHPSHMDVTKTGVWVERIESWRQCITGSKDKYGLKNQVESEDENQIC